MRSVFASGLNRPFGMALVGNDFYVANTGARRDAAGNRVHVGPDRIFRIAHGQATVAAEGDSTLFQPNGILYDPRTQQFILGPVASRSVWTWRPGSDPVQAPASQSPRLALSSFIFARYATVSASSLYAAYSFGPAGVVVGMVDNPRSGYRELIGGLVTRVAWGKQGVSLAVAAAAATDSQYLQTYLVPSLTAGLLSLSSTIEWCEPLEATGVRQLDVNPVAVFIRPRTRGAIPAGEGPEWLGGPRAPP